MPGIHLEMMVPLRYSFHMAYPDLLFYSSRKTSLQETGTEGRGEHAAPEEVSGPADSGAQQEVWHHPLPGLRETGES